MRWAVFCTYTVSVIVGANVGALGPFLTGGAFWNYTCIDQVINTTEGLYEEINNCHERDWFMVAEVFVRIPFQLWIISNMNTYYKEKKLEEERSHKAA